MRVASFNSTIKRQSVYNKVNVIYTRILIMRSCRVVYHYSYIFVNFNITACNQMCIPLISFIFSIEENPGGIFVIYRHRKTYNAEYGPRLA